MLNGAAIASTGHKKAQRDVGICHCRHQVHKSRQEQNLLCIKLRVCFGGVEEMHLSRPGAWMISEQLGKDGYQRVDADASGHEDQPVYLPDVEPGRGICE